MACRTEIAKYRKENLLLKKQIEDRTGKAVEQLYAERAKRVRDVIELREPDRVPFMVLVEPHSYSGIPQWAAFYDPITLKRTMRKMALDLEPDMASPVSRPVVLQRPSWMFRTSYGPADQKRRIMNTSSSKGNT